MHFAAENGHKFTRSGGVQVGRRQACAEPEAGANQAAVEFDLVAADEQAVVGNAELFQRAGAKQRAVEQGRDAGQEVVVAVDGFEVARQFEPGRSLLICEVGEPLGALGVAYFWEFGVDAAFEKLLAMTTPHQPAAQGECQLVRSLNIADHRRDSVELVASRAAVQRLQHVGVLRAAVVIGAPNPLRAQRQRSQHAQCETTSAAQVRLGAEVVNLRRRSAFRRLLRRHLLSELLDLRVIAVVDDDEPLRHVGLAGNDGKRLTQVLDAVVSHHDCGRCCFIVLWVVSRVFAHFVLHRGKYRLLLFLLLSILPCCSGWAIPSIRAAPPAARRLPASRSLGHYGEPRPDSPRSYYRRCASTRRTWSAASLPS